MKKEYSLWDRSGTNGARTSALPMHIAGFTRPSKWKVKREEYGDSVERMMGIELYYLLYWLLFCNATAAGRGNDDEDEVDCVEVMDVDVVIIMMVRL